MNEELLNEFKEQIIFRLDESSRMNMKSLALISEEDVWKRFNQSSNSIGNLILHLCGNITQYAIASLGNKEDQRNRDLEFSTEEGYTKAELLNKLSGTVQEAKRIILETSQEEYLRKREVQGFNFSGIGIAIHVTEHYSYHTGQIAFWVKQLKNKDLGFYDGMDLTVKNK
ncbi:DinB family protein [uncultured Tenacibaculum sp.]|uniref:DinB family protein n=1 Tax=uncultured Tenacibaculum sp. TaxID=174713 RepID=UPI00261A9A5B|nr:DinB family protein [uncultured Tenacibaculum sp.]